jgi:hypothetical protein
MLDLLCQGSSKTIRLSLPSGADPNSINYKTIVVPTEVSGCEDWEERQVQIGYLSGKKDSNFNAVGRGICGSLDIPASVFKGVSKKGMVQVH